MQLILLQLALQLLPVIGQGLHYVGQVRLGVEPEFPSSTPLGTHEALTVRYRLQSAKCLGIQMSLAPLLLRFPFALLNCFPLVLLLQKQIFPFTIVVLANQQGFSCRP